MLLYRSISHVTLRRAKQVVIPLLCTLALLGSQGIVEAQTNVQEASTLWRETDDSGLTIAKATKFEFDRVRFVEDIGPAVVNVVVTYGAGSVTNAPRIASGSEWHEGRVPGIAQGTGFIIHPSGLILTNFHVIDGASKITIRLMDGTEYDAAILGIDPQTDIALIRIEGQSPFPAVTLGNSDRVRVGEPVMAIGNPLGLTHTVTSGIVSALGRRNLTIEGREFHADFIQTDASINPGNSGGPLISASGHVIGMNTAINRHGQGIGFAIPINMVKTLLPQLHDHGYVIRNWLGVRVQELHPVLAQSFGMEHSRGALVTEVIAKSPAGRAGIKSGDVILTFNKSEILSSDHLPWMVSTYTPNGEVELSLFRDNKVLSIPVTLEQLPDQSPPRFPRLVKDESEPRAASASLDIGVNSLSETLARQLSAPSTDGVVVTSIGDNSPAKGAGLRIRDVIVEVGEQPVSNQEDYNNAVDSPANEAIVRFKVFRAGRAVYIAFER